MITCPNPDCRHPNADNAIYCSNCGQKLKTEPQKNILELYPNLNLTPTNFYNWRKPWLRHVYSVLIVGLLGFLLVAIHDTFVRGGKEYYNKYHSCYMCFSDGWFFGCNTTPSDNCQTPYEAHKLALYIKKLLIAGFSGIDILLMALFLLRFRYPTTNLHTVADYVQKYRFSGFFVTRKTRKYTFFVKNNQFGVLDYAHYKVALSAQYDYLEWHTKNKYLNATVNGETFIMDINGNKLK